MNVNNITPTKETVVQPPVQVEGTGGQNRATENKEIIQAKQVQEQNAESKEELKAVTESLNEYMSDFQTQLGFFINEELNDEVIVEIKNRNTDELIKQIPSEEVVAIREKMAELTGLLFDKSV